MAKESRRGNSIPFSPAAAARTGSAAAGLFILTRISAELTGTGAIGGLLFCSGLLAALWNQVYRNGAGAVLPVRSAFVSGSELGLLILSAVTVLSLCGVRTRQSMRLLLPGALVAAQFFGASRLRQMKTVSRNVRFLGEAVLHGLLAAAMAGLLLWDPMPKSTALQCFGAFVLSALLLIVFDSPAREQEKREPLPASFALWLRTLSADWTAGACCGMALTGAVLIRLGGRLTAVLLAASLACGCVIYSQIRNSVQEYAVCRRAGLSFWLAAAVICAAFPDTAILTAFLLPLYALGWAMLCSGSAAMKPSFVRLLAFCSERETPPLPGPYIRAAAWETLLSCGLIVLAVFAGGLCVLPAGSRLATPGIMMILLGIGLVFLIRSWILTTQQPLDRAGSEKIRRALESGDSREAARLRDRVRERYQQPFRRSAGFWAVKTLFRPFFPSRFIGRENIDESGETPMVFVCNHLEIYGPVITQLHLPFAVTTWIINNMVDQNLTEQNLSGAIDKIFKFLPLPVRRGICRILARPVCWAMNSIDHVTVYRGGTRDVVRTIRDTVDAIQCGDNILLFPENTSAAGETGAYKIGEVSAFFSGFSNIASSVYEKTGQCITFYPLFADKKKRKIRAEKGITFDPSVPKPEEKKRIVTYLHDTMCEMAELSRKS